MSAVASVSADPMRRRAVQVDTARLLPRLVAALEICQPRTRGELMQVLGITDIEANVALDRAQTAGELCRSIQNGRIVYTLPDWTAPLPGRSESTLRPVVLALTASAAVESAPVDAPEPPAQPEPPVPIEAAAAAEALPPLGAVSLAILGALAEAPSPLHLGLAFAEASGLKPNTLKNALQRLKVQGLVTSCGLRRGTRWQLTDAGQTAVALTVSATAADAAPEAVHAADAFDPATDELLAWHADAAEREAARRAAARTAQPVFGDLNDLLLGDAFRNDAALPPADVVEVAQSIDIHEARYALWSDGQLEIDAGDARLTFSPAAARGLIHYLDRLTGASA